MLTHSHTMTPFDAPGKQAFLKHCGKRSNCLYQERVCRLKEFADNNFIFDKNGRKLSERLENTVGKGEIACYKAISPFPTVFSKGLFPRGVKRFHCVGMG